MIHRLAAIATAAATLCAWAPAIADGVPVIDLQSLTNVQSILKQAQNQTSLLGGLKDINGQISSALGAVGLPDPASDFLSTSSVLGTNWQPFTNGGTMAQALKQYPLNTSNIVPGAGPSNLGDLQSTHDWVNKSFYGAGSLTMAASRSLDEMRGRSEREAALTGYALAMVSRSDLAAAASRGSNLQNIVQGTTDLRGDIRANSAIALAQYEQMQNQLALLTALVEIEATHAIGGDDKAASGGSQTVINAYNPTDFDNAGARLSVSALPSSGLNSAVQNPTLSYLAGNLVGGNFSQYLSSASTIPIVNQSSQIAALAKVASSILSANGQGSLGAAVNQLSVALQNSSSNPYGVVWAGAQVTAQQSGDNGMSSIVSQAQSAASSNNGPAINSLLSTALSAASHAGDTAAVANIQSATAAFNAGSMNPNDAALTATNYIGQYGGYSSGPAVAQAVNQDPTTATDAQISSYGMSILNGVSNSAGVSDLSNFTSTVNSNQSALTNLVGP